MVTIKRKTTYDPAQEDAVILGGIRGAQIPVEMVDNTSNPMAGIGKSKVPQLNPPAAAAQWAPPPPDVSQPEVADPVADSGKPIESAPGPQGSPDVPQQQQPTEVKKPHRNRQMLSQLQMPVADSTTVK